MTSNDTKSISTRAKQIYEASLRESLERDCPGQYVAIEPMSGDHFIGPTFDDAVNTAIAKYSERVTFTIRVGHRAALHLGVADQ